MSPTQIVIERARIDREIAKAFRLGDEAAVCALLGQMGELLYKAY